MILNQDSCPSHGAIVIELVNLAQPGLDRLALLGFLPIFVIDFIVSWEEIDSTNGLSHIVLFAVVNSNPHSDLLGSRVKYVDLSSRLHDWPT